MSAEIEVRECPACKRDHEVIEEPLGSVGVLSVRRCPEIDLDRIVIINGLPPFYPLDASLIPQGDK